MAEADYVNLDFFQETFPAGAKAEVDAGEYLDEFEGEAIFQVDWARKTVSWRLPDFPRFAGFEAAGALGSLSVVKNNLEVLMKLSNRTRAQNAAPSVKVYPKYPVETGDPNALICFVDHFSPPVLNVTWLKNGQMVSKGVEETAILPRADHAFRKFSYLPFVPEEGDFYTCRVEHRGLPEPLTVIWSPEESTPDPDTAENVLCGLGLAFGILGIIVGTILFLKATRMTDHNSRNGRSGGL
ncbi:HLA class II histocompatibility antigen, DR alpha chain-like isoform X2 [Anolis carolinensis]|uniref:HLA class II histocompatibility antigen, DR alpha chain-like isoform X2 n=1 Tax=Anolis carolinensis TaxID=28377 RepID=UPI002F2B6EE4